MIKSLPNITFFFVVLFIVSCTPNSKRDALLKKESLIENTGEIENSIVHNNFQPQYSNKDGLRIVSWNIQDLGKTKNSKEILQIAQIVRDFDIIALQEVVAKDPGGAQAVAKIADELNRMGFKWDYQISNPTKSPSGNISERYAFLWKTSKLNLVYKAYLDKELETIFFREPFIATFKIKGETIPFYVVNYHSRKYYDKPEEEIIHFLDYRRRLKSDRIIIAGDFNLDENHQVWKPFYRNGFRCALKETPTTLKMKCKNGNYTNHAIDNIYFDSGIKLLQSGSVDFVGSCQELEKARGISDHLPVFMEFKVTN